MHRASCRFMPPCGITETLSDVESVRVVHHLHFSPEIETTVKETKKNPKRAQRDAKKQTLETGIGTKSQQALKLQQEQNKLERKCRSREQKEAENQRLFELKQEKKREKHKGH